MEHENNYASKGVGGTALGLSIGAVAAELLGGNLGNIFGGNRGGESAPVSHTEAKLMAENAELKNEVKFRDSTIYTDNKMLELYKYFEGKFSCVENQLCEQRVYNATNTAAISCIQGQVAQLAALTKVIIPIGNVCPQPMPQYNSWVAPTTPTGTTGA
jgi:hypothetical protein